MIATKLPTLHLSESVAVGLEHRLLGIELVIVTAVSLDMVHGGVGLHE
jgi:hypothetical protein